MSNLQKVLKKYYPHAIVQGEKPEQTAAKVLEDLQKYKMNTPTELFKHNVDFAKKAMEYCYPNSTGIPELQKELLNEFFQKCLTGEHVVEN